MILLSLSLSLSPPSLPSSICIQPSHAHTHTHTHTHTVTLMQDPNAVAVSIFGFLVIGRTVSDGSMVGTFADPSTANNLTQLSRCTPTNTVGVTHNNPAIPRTSITGPLSFTWTAPAAGTGAVEFRYAIVQNLLTWWANDASATIQEGEGRLMND